jgi:hypothetical protein
MEKQDDGGTCFGIVFTHAFICRNGRMEQMREFAHDPIPIIRRELNHGSLRSWGVQDGSGGQVRQDELAAQLPSQGYPRPRA